MTEKIISELTNFFSKNADFTSVVLYGSFAKNSANKESDLDLAVIPEKKMTADLKIRTIGELSNIFHRSIDLVDLTTIHAPLLQEVLTNGIWIKLDSNQTKEKYIKKMIYEVEDFLPLREKIQTEKIKRFIGK